MVKHLKQFPEIKKKYFLLLEGKEAEDLLLKTRESYDSTFAESSILIDLRRGLMILYSSIG